MERKVEKYISITRKKSEDSSKNFLLNLILIFMLVRRVIHFRIVLRSFEKFLWTTAIIITSRMIVSLFSFKKYKKYRRVSICIDIEYEYYYHFAIFVSRLLIP